MTMIPDCCPICDSTRCRVFPNIFFKNILWRCLDCGLIFVYPQPALTELKKIYSQNYFKNNTAKYIGYEDYLEDKPNVTKSFVKRFKKIKKLYPTKGRILDLGCAMGFGLEAAQKYGFDPYGVEISDYASAVAKKTFGEKIICGTLNQACFPDNFFSIITMWDYLEHIPDPRQELSRVKKLLQPDGLLVISTPDAGSWPHKIFKNRWMGYKDQEHLFYFSRPNLTKLLEKTGFGVIKTEMAGKYVSLDIFIDRLSLYSQPLAKILKFIVAKTKLNHLAVYINPLDIVCLYAKK